MNAASQATWAFFAMILLACSGWYFASETMPTKLDEQTLSNTADTFVENLTVRQFDTKGSLANYMESSEMQHIPDKDTNIFKSPHIVLRQENQPSWDIRSEKANSINKGEEIIFINQVIIHQEKGEHTQESTFKTAKITYFPKKKFATTPLAVIFEQPGSIVHAVGMNAYLENKHVELLSKAHAIYQPNHA